MESVIVNPEWVSNLKRGDIVVHAYGGTAANLKPVKCVVSGVGRNYVEVRSKNNSIRRRFNHSGRIDFPLRGYSYFLIPVGDGNGIRN